jgi:NOL1/NOP2/fmu family ribosome biogenesis protein
VRAFGEQLTERFGCSFLTDDDALFQREDRLLLTSGRIASFHLPVADYALGMPFAKRLQDDRIVLDNDLITLRGGRANANVIEISDEQLALLLKAQDCSCEPERSGATIIRHHGIPVGLGLAKAGAGILKNNLPRWMVRFD